MLSCYKKVIVKGSTNFPIPVSQGNQLLVSYLSFKKWFMHTQALCLNLFPTEKQGYRLPLKNRGFPKPLERPTLSSCRKVAAEPSFLS